MLSLWTDADSTKLWRLAKDIENQESWRGYLSTQEHLIFKNALERGGETWSRFLVGNVTLNIDIEPSATDSEAQVQPSQSQPPSQQQSQLQQHFSLQSHLVAQSLMGSPRDVANTRDQTPSNMSDLSVTLDPVAIAFRVRYMLYERALPVMFPELGASVGIAPSVFESEQPEKTIPKKVQSRTVDDDYDENEEEEDGEEEEEDKSDKEEANSDNAVIKITVPGEGVEDKKSKDAAIHNFNKQYHTYEKDRENALKQRKLEESDRQVDSDTFENVDTEHVGNKVAAFGAANLSLKHLLATIENKRDSLQITELELRNLISDVKKNRSKWASEDKIGQEELYEAAEKVVLELRGYTEHSTAFLNKVNKRDAPNYFNIIKHPMDLNLVMKKLKTFQYKSKKEFVADLMLIWRNCLTYNTDPKHFLRGHAFAMQKKTLSLIPLIPDITVRDRAEVEAEERESTAALANGTEEKDQPSGRKGAGKHTSKGSQKRRFEQVEGGEIGGADDSTDAGGDVATDANGAATDAAVTDTASVISGTDAAAAAAAAAASASGAPASGAPAPIASPASETPNSPTPLEYEMGAIEERDSDVEEDLDFESKIWQDVFTQKISKYCITRQDLFKDNMIQPDAPAVFRQGSAMGRFSETMESAFNESDFSLAHEDQRRPFRSSQTLLESLENDKQQFIMDYEVQQGCPPPLLSNKVSDDDEYVHDISDYVDKSGNLKPSDYVVRTGLGHMINDNLREMQKIRKICAKISLIRQVQQQSYLHPLMPYDPPEIAEPDIDAESRIGERDLLNAETSFVAIKRATAKLCMHSGFEVTDPMALEAISEIAADYLGKMGRLLVNNIENDRENRFSDEDLLLSTMSELGIDGVGSLEAYIRDGIERHGSKLKDLYRRLAIFFTDLLRPAFNGADDSQFKDGSDQFLNGDFSQEVGDDFFGFKELGLDKEFGLLNSSVPFHLLSSRLSITLNSQSSVKAEKELNLDLTPDYPPLDRANVSRIIGLLRPMFLAKVDVSPGGVIIEDEALPPKQRNIRARLPPNGKISGPRKKQVANMFELPDPKPTSNPVPHPEPSEPPLPSMFVDANSLQLQADHGKMDLDPDISFTELMGDAQDNDNDLDALFS